MAAPRYWKCVRCGTIAEEIRVKVGNPITHTEEDPAICHVRMHWVDSSGKTYQRDIEVCRTCFYRTYQPLLQPAEVVNAQS